MGKPHFEHPPAFIEIRDPCEVSGKKMTALFKSCKKYGFLLQIAIVCAPLSVEKCKNIVLECIGLAAELNIAQPEFFVVYKAIKEQGAANEIVLLLADLLGSGNAKPLFRPLG